MDVVGATPTLSAKCNDWVRIVLRGGLAARMIGSWLRTCFFMRAEIEGKKRPSASVNITHVDVRGSP